MNRVNVQSSSSSCACSWAFCSQNFIFLLVPGSAFVQKVPEEVWFSSFQPRDAQRWWVRLLVYPPAWLVVSRWRLQWPLRVSVAFGYMMVMPGLCASATPTTALTAVVGEDSCSNRGEGHCPTAHPSRWLVGDGRVPGSGGQSPQLCWGLGHFPHLELPALVLLPCQGPGEGRGLWDHPIPTPTPRLDRWPEGAAECPC